VSALVIAAAAVAPAGAARAAAEIAWEKSFPAAMQKAKASKKLVMVDFYTDW
jgi:thiol:disulfide interchange protein